MSITASVLKSLYYVFSCFNWQLPLKKKNYTFKTCYLCWCLFSQNECDSSIQVSICCVYLTVMTFDNSLKWASFGNGMHNYLATLSFHLYLFLSVRLICDAAKLSCVTEMPIWEIFLRQTALIPMWLNLLFLGIRPKKTPVLNWADNDFCQRVKMPTHHIPTEFILPSILYIFYNVSYLYNVSSLGLFIHYLIEQKIQEQFSIHFKSQY